MTAPRRLQARVRGRVQGVSFRAYTAMQGRRLGLSGLVRNLSDGSVEVIAEGDEHALAALVAFLHRGSPAARVDGVDLSWLPAEGDLDSFDVG